jgi:ElaB/YqjD/DUF883 family membrane-anchored ribosome-binding protein
MAKRKTLRDELEDLRIELAGIKRPIADLNLAADEPESPLSGHLAELNRLVQTMLDEAEDTITEHPVATVAGALALGIVIGRLSAR